MQNSYTQFYPSITPEDFRAILSLSIFAVSKSNPNLDAVWYSEERRHWVATDGHRLVGYKPSNLDNCEPLETCYFPRELAKEMLKVKFERVNFKIPNLGHDEGTHTVVIELVPKNGIAISFNIPDLKVEPRTLPPMLNFSFAPSDYENVDEPTGFNMDYLADISKYVKKSGNGKNPKSVYHGHQKPIKGSATVYGPTLWTTAVDGFAMILMPLRIN